MSARVILYVEDDDSAFHLAKIVLREEEPSIQLFRASDGEQALNMLHRLAPYQNAPRPDLILLDLNLPKMDGFEVLAALKAAESLRSIPVVMFSTSSSRRDSSNSQALGARDYVTKPCSFDGFVEALRRACSLPDRGAGAGSDR
jgi:CheY-like chemotaxis protein